MVTFRHHLLRHRLLAGWLIAAALIMKVLVPSGYMLGTSSTGSIVVEVCSGYGPQKMVISIPGMKHHPDKKGERGKTEMPCAFSGLSAPSLSGADPLLLAVAIAFVILTVFRIAARPALPGAPSYLRPPLRGPPAHA